VCGSLARNNNCEHRNQVTGLRHPTLNKWFAIT